MKRFTVSLLSLLLCVSLAACFGGGDAGESAPDAEAEEAAEEGAESGTEGLAQLGEAMSEMGKALSEGSEVEPVDFRELRALFPESVEGMERTSATGERTGAMGIKLSQAKAEYSDDDGRRLNLTILDLGSMKSAAMLGYSWLMAEFDRETDTGYERTTRYKGHPAFEKFEQNGDYLDAEMQVVVGERFVIQAEGTGIEMDVLKDAVDEIDLGDLEELGEDAS